MNAGVREAVMVFGNMVGGTVRWGSLVGGSLALVLLAAPAAEARKLRPVDQGSRDPSFAAFRKRLLEATRKRDLPFVMSVLDPKIGVSFSADYTGIAGFKKMWQPEKPDTRFWATLERVLSLGGSFHGKGADREFCAPYVFSDWPDNVEPVGNLAVLGEKVSLRSAPRDGASVIRTLSYDIVRQDDERPQEETPGKESQWVRVRTADGKRGYLPRRLIRSPIDYRACFKKVGGKWRMTLLIAGD